MWLASIVIVSLAAAAIYFMHRRTATTFEPQPPQTTARENHYIDPTVCADCHPKIWETYRQTGMGRSFSLPTAGNAAGANKNAVTFYHKASGSYFAMIERGG